MEEELYHLSDNLWVCFFQEYELLFYSLSSARIFFRADLTAEEEKANSDAANKDKGKLTNMKAYFLFFFLLYYI